MKYNKAKYVASYPKYRLIPELDLPEFAFGGRSNVGKSSLINSLLNQKKLAQISKTPGKTQKLNYFAIMDNKGCDQMFFVDLPGYGYAKISKEIKRGWKNLVEDYIGNRKNLKGFALLTDSRRGLEEEEFQLIEYLFSLDKDICLILTKADKLKQNQKSEIVRRVTQDLKFTEDNSLFPILHSSKTGLGNDLIWRWIGERI